MVQVEMKVNRGKQFEDIIKHAFLAVDGVSLDRLADPTSGYLGIRNISDFIVYKNPHQYYIECKSIHGNTFPLKNLTDNQYFGMLEKAKIPGVVCGVIIWFVDRDVTMFVPIDSIREMKDYQKVSIRFDETFGKKIIIPGKKKRVFFEYDMQKFFEGVDTL